MVPEYGRGVGDALPQLSQQEHHGQTPGVCSWSWVQASQFSLPVLCFLTPVLVAAALLSELMAKIVSGLTLKVLSFPRPPPIFKRLKERSLPSSGLPHYPASGSSVLEFIIQDLFCLWASWPLTGMQVPGDALWLHRRGAREVNWESQKFRNLLTQPV